MTSQRPEHLCQCPLCGKMHHDLQNGRPPGLKARGVGRMADNDKAVLLIFDRPLTDDELRALHDQTNIMSGGAI